ncbi:hypothetical protein D8I24_0552 (plasmid) [Cupriavidus necator H850]|nr:hypothetical protein D8I24_0552 [Cupriavidus necator H850]
MQCLSINMELYLELWDPQSPRCRQHVTMAERDGKAMA